MEPHLAEWRGLFRGNTPALVAPADKVEAAEVLRICQQNRIGVVPQGGNTGLAGGAIPQSTPDQPQILMSARRMNRIRDLDAANYTVTAEAGCLVTNSLLAEVEGEPHVTVRDV